METINNNPDEFKSKIIQILMQLILFWTTVYGTIFSIINQYNKLAFE